MKMNEKMKRLARFLVLSCFMTLALVSCKPRDERGQEAKEPKVSVEHKKEQNLVEIASARDGNSIAYTEFKVYRISDNGCTYYIVSGSTSNTEGGVSVKMIHSASCDNPIHRGKEEYYDEAE